MIDDAVFDLRRHPVHLGKGARAIVQEEHDGTPQWYERYGRRHGDEGVEGRLVSMHTFSEPWDTWEMHPHGDEIVCCVAGEITLHQELPSGERRTVVLAPGEAVVNAPGTWHTADVESEATAFFVTAGAGTEIRPR